MKKPIKNLLTTTSMPTIDEKRGQICVIMPVQLASQDWPNFHYSSTGGTLGQQIFNRKVPEKIINVFNIWKSQNIWLVATWLYNRNFLNHCTISVKSKTEELCCVKLSIEDILANRFVSIIIFRV